MAELDAQTRAALPDTAFAYVDGRGRRRLPIHDESHVRNALARFNQVRFESVEARERAFQKVLRAALEHGIAPVGFVTRQIRAARERQHVPLPSGPVTILMTDIEGSTSLSHRLGDGYAAVLDRTRELIRRRVTAAGGYEVDARADEFFAVFSEAAAALRAAVAVQRALDTWDGPDGERVRVRIGLHAGQPALTDTGYIGLPVSIAARVCAAGHGGQILLTGETRDQLASRLPRGLTLTPLGVHAMHGLPDPVEILQVAGSGDSYPPLRRT